MSANGQRERLRFTGFEFDRSADGRCSARVVLEWQEGDAFSGEADGLGPDAGELRCSAQAALTALNAAVQGRAVFELLGVKAVKAFDSTVVIVSIAATLAGRAARLVGSQLAEDASPRNAAVAVLHATNRLLGNIFVRDGK